MTMSDVPWTDPKFDLTEENRVKLERALQRAHRRAPGRSQADLHEHGTVSEGVEYGRPVPPTAREDWHAQQREQALAEQAGHDQELGRTGEFDSTGVVTQPSGFGMAPDRPNRVRSEWHEQQRQRALVNQGVGDQAPGNSQSILHSVEEQHRRPVPRDAWHENQRRLAEAEAEALSEQEALRRMAEGGR